MSEQTLNLIKENEVRWVDLRFTDTRGKEQHVTIPSKLVDEDFFEGGKMFWREPIVGKIGWFRVLRVIPTETWLCTPGGRPKSDWSSTSLNSSYWVREIE